MQGCERSPACPEGLCSMNCDCLTFCGGRFHSCKVLPGCVSSFQKSH